MAQCTVSVCLSVTSVVFVIQKRHLLEDSNQLDARRSALDDDLEEMDEDEEEGEFKVWSVTEFYTP